MSCSFNEQDNLGSINVMSQKLQSNLKLLSDYSYTCKHYSGLKKVNDKVSAVLEDALSTLPTEKKLILRMSPSKKKQKTLLSRNIQNYILYQWKDIKRLSLFEKYKSRVGTFADKVKVKSQVNVTMENKIDLTIHNTSMDHLGIGNKITTTGT